jgi:hypothetical protein
MYKGWGTVAWASITDLILSGTRYIKVLHSRGLMLLRKYIKKDYQMLNAHLPLKRNSL